MDPVSAAASITGLITLVTSVVTLTNKYISDARRATESATALFTELNALQKNLTRLDAFLKHEQSKGVTFRDTSVLLASSKTCARKLDKLHAKLQKVGSGSVIGQLVWPLQKSECQDYIQELRSFSACIEFALSIDGFALLSKTSEEVSKIFQDQLINTNYLRVIDQQMRLVQDSVAIQGQALENQQADKKRRKLLAWLSRYDHELQHDALKNSRVQGTGTWLLEEKGFLNWRDDDDASPFLWCPGIPGSGKTVIASLVIDHLRMQFGNHEKVKICFVYFDYKKVEEQSLTTVLASLIKQIYCNANTIVPKFLWDAYESHQDNSKLAARDLQRILDGVVVEFGKVFIVIDALDESDALSHRKPFLKVLKELAAIPCIRILITSRPHPQDIQGLLKSSPQIPIEPRHADLILFIDYAIEEADRHDVINETFKRQIIESVVNGARGMFLLPALQISAIMQEPTVGDMKHALGTMLGSLKEALASTIARIKRQPESTRLLALCTLMWLSQTSRPLKLAELADALSLRPNTQQALDPEYRPQARSIIDCCQGLVVIDPGTTTVRFVHFTVQEYLTNPESRVFPIPPRRTAAFLTLRYLCDSAFARQICQNKAELDALIEQHPFLPFAAQNWGDFVRTSQTNVSVRAMALAFLHSPIRPALMNQILRYRGGFNRSYWEPLEAQSNTGLMVACHFGLTSIVMELLDADPALINATTVIGTTPIIKAAARNHVETVIKLLNRGADAGQRNQYGNALHCAAEAGAVDAMRVLLDFGMDPNELSPYDRTPLSCCLDRDSDSAAEMLLDHGADHKNIGIGQETFHETLVVASIEDGAINILKLLIRRGLDDELLSKDEDGSTLLHLAVETYNSSPETVQAIIDAGADVNTENDDGMTPLDIASDPRIIQILLAAGAEKRETTRPKVKTDLEDEIDAIQNLRLEEA